MEKLYHWEKNVDEMMKVYKEKRKYEFLPEFMEKNKSGGSLFFFNKIAKKFDWLIEWCRALERLRLYG